MLWKNVVRFGGWHKPHCHQAVGISDLPTVFVWCFVPHPLSVVFSENWMILALLYYPALCYPLLACGTLHNKVGYVLGSLLSWTHFSVLVWQKIDCPKTPQVRTKMSSVTVNMNDESLYCALSESWGYSEVTLVHLTRWPDVKMWWSVS